MDADDETILTWHSAFIVNFHSKIYAKITKYSRNSCSSHKIYPNISFMYIVREIWHVIRIGLSNQNPNFSGFSNTGMDIM